MVSPIWTENLFVACTNHVPMIEVCDLFWKSQFVGCQKGCRTDDRSPPGGLQLTYGKTNSASKNVQDKDVLTSNVGGLGGNRCKKNLVDSVSSLYREHMERTAGAEMKSQLFKAASYAAWVCVRKRLVAHDAKKVTPWWTRKWEMLFKQRK